MATEEKAKFRRHTDEHDRLQERFDRLCVEREGVRRKFAGRRELTACVEASLRVGTEEIEKLRRSSGACGREHDAKKDALELKTAA